MFATDVLRHDELGCLGLEVQRQFQNDILACQAYISKACSF